MQTESANGSCLCGAVRFSARLPSRWVAHCHCTRCQRAHGAAFVTWAGFDEGAVSIDAAPGELHVARALFIDPLDREPQMHAYFDSHVSWVALADSLPTRPDPGAADEPGGPPQ